MSQTQSHTVTERAREAASWFETATRPNGDPFVRLRDGGPDWVADLVRVAHGDMLPDDWRYWLILEAVEFIAECECDPRDAVHDFAESVVSTIPLGACIDWLGSHLERVGYVDEARGELGGGESVADEIRAGLMLEAEEVFGAVLATLQDDRES